MYLFLTEQLDYWSLQFYKRLRCHVNVKVISTDPHWASFATNFINLPKLKNREVKPTVATLRRRAEGFDTTAVSDFRPEANKSYSVSVKYTVTKGNGVLSSNFFGSGKDFEQVHTKLATDPVWQTATFNVKTGHFMSEEKVDLRFWCVHSDPGTVIRLHKITVSEHEEIINFLKPHVALTEKILVNYQSNEVIDWVLTFPNAEKLKSLFSYEFETIKDSVKTYCTRRHRPSKTDLCYVLDSIHESEDTSDGSLVEGNRFIDKDKEIAINCENTEPCIPYPATIDFTVQKALVIGFFGDPALCDTIKKTGLPCVRITDSLKNIGILLIADDLDKNLNLIIDAWSKGILVATFEAIPVNLINSAIQQMDLSGLTEFTLNWPLHNTLRDLGYLAARWRSLDLVRNDFMAILRGWND